MSAIPVENDEIDNNLKSALQAVLSDAQYDKVRAVGASIAKGLTLFEACTISQVDIDKLITLQSKHKQVQDYIAFKQTSFKATLLKQLSTQAMNGDAKLAQWFMERLYEEYNPRYKQQSRDTSEEDHPLYQGLAYVRQNGDKNPLAVKDIIIKDDE